LDIKLFNNQGGTMTVQYATFLFSCSAINGYLRSFPTRRSSDLDLSDGTYSTLTGNFAGSGTGTIRFNTGKLIVADAGASFNFTGDGLRTRLNASHDPGTLANAGTWTDNGGDKYLSGILSNTGTL